MWGSLARVFFTFFTFLTLVQCSGMMSVGGDVTHMFRNYSICYISGNHLKHSEDNWTSSELPNITLRLLINSETLQRLPKTTKEFDFKGHLEEFVNFSARFTWWSKSAWRNKLSNNAFLHFLPRRSFRCWNPRWQTPRLSKLVLTRCVRHLDDSENEVNGLSCCTFFLSSSHTP